MITTYNQYKDDDGFLYVTYSGDSTFGSATTRLEGDVLHAVLADLAAL